jgi:hypothetical protein
MIRGAVVLELGSPVTRPLSFTHGGGVDTPSVTAIAGGGDVLESFKGSDSRSVVPALMDLMKNPEGSPFAAMA